MKEEDVELAFHCPKSVDELQGEGPIRHCDQCDHEVALLSHMTYAEARAFVQSARASGASSCVAYDVTSSGHVEFVSDRVKQQLAGAAALLATAALVATSVTSAFAAADGRELSARYTAPATRIIEASSPASVAKMEVPDPNAAFDSWEFVGFDDESRVAILRGTEGVDIESFRLAQAKRDARRAEHRVGKLALDPQYLDIIPGHK